MTEYGVLNLTTTVIKDPPYSDTSYPGHFKMAGEVFATPYVAPRSEFHDRHVFVSAMAHGIARMATTSTAATAALEMMREMRSEGLFTSIDDLLIALSGFQLPERVLMGLLVGTAPYARHLPNRRRFALFVKARLEQSEDYKDEAATIEKYI